MIDYCFISVNSKIGCLNSVRDFKRQSNNRIYEGNIVYEIVYMKNVSSIAALGVWIGMGTKQHIS